MAGKKRLSLCLVVGEEHEYLTGCLEDMKEAADEIIIADCGSGDPGIEPAEASGVFQRGGEHPAARHKIKWNGSFSEAKNFCMEHAEGRWVLLLRANETISRDQLKELALLLDNPNAEGYLLYADNRPEDYGIHSPVESLRLLRNRREYRFLYKAFERLPDELLSNIEDSGIKITQRGGSGQFRDFRFHLLEEELLEYPDDCYLRYMYGIELLNRQRYEESITYFQESLRDVNYEYLFAPHLLKCLSWAFIYLQRYPEALEVLEEGEKAFPVYSDFLVLKAEVHKQLGQYEDAVRELEDSLTLAEQQNIMVPAPEIDGSVILELLGEVHEQASNYRQALACYLQLYEPGNTGEEFLSKIAWLAERTDSTDLLENLLIAAEEQDHGGQLRQEIIEQFLLKLQ